MHIRNLQRDALKKKKGITLNDYHNFTGTIAIDLFTTPLLKC